MKKLKFKNGCLMFLFASLILFLGSCKKDDDNKSSSKNYMQLDDSEYELSKGVLENYGKDEGVDGYNLDLTLLSSGLKIVEEGGEVSDISGTGHSIYFDIYTSTSKKLDLGSYEYDSTGTGELGTFAYGGCIADYNTETKEGVNLELSDGTLTVTKNDGVYEISIDCTAEDGTNVTGYYKGSLKYYNYDDNTKSAKIKIKKMR